VTRGGHWRLFDAHVMAAERLHADRCWPSPKPILTMLNLNPERPVVSGHGPAGGNGLFTHATPKGEHPQGHLARHAGILQADAYDGYNQLIWRDDSVDPSERLPGRMSIAICRKIQPPPVGRSA
jgi:hypothetical protein